MLGSLDADDAANETFRRAQHRLGRFDATRPFGRWLLSIAAHDCVDRLRRRSLEKRIFDVSPIEIEDRADTRTTALNELVQNRQQAAVRDAIDRLPDAHRAPLVLRYFAELDYDAIAEELELTRSQVASSIFRAKRRLRDLLHSERETIR